MDFTELAIEFAEVSKTIKKLDSEVKAGKERLAQIEPVLLEHMIEAGMESVKIIGMTVYIRTQIWSAVEDKVAAVAALKASGFGDLVSETYNTNTLSALCRERIASEQPLPVEWAGIIGTIEKTTLQARKA